MADSKIDEEALSAVFNLADLDGSGTISAAELGKLLRAARLNPTEKDVRLLVARFDKDKNGELDMEEFRALYMEMREKEPKSPEELIRESFKVFDMNGDGFIDRSELHYVLTALGEGLTEQEANAILAEVDDNGDGKIDYEEFVKMLSSY